MFDSPTDITNIKYRLGVYNFIILAVLTGIAIVVYFNIIPTPQTFQLLTYTACAGGIGGVIYSVRTFTTHSNADTLEYKDWYYLFPLTTIFFGGFSFFLVAGGVLVLSGAPENTGPFIAQTIYFYIAIAFLAGFSTEQFTKKINEVSDVLFAKVEETPVPVIESISPSDGSGAGNVTVSITGTGFKDATAVKFGSIPAQFSVNSDTSITAQSPPGSPGKVDVIVMTPGGSSAISDNSKFTYE